MTNTHDRLARQCTRCGRTIAPRGGKAPRFCAVCGERLQNSTVDVVHDAAPLGPRPAGASVAALVLGIWSFIPMCGPLFGITAIVMGVKALSDLQGKPFPKPGNGMAITGIVLGVFGTILSLLVCGGVR